MLSKFLSINVAQEEKYKVKKDIPINPICLLNTCSMGTVIALCAYNPLFDSIPNFEIYLLTL